MADLSPAYLNQIVGAAIFDLSGLPKEYFTAGERTNMGWVQTIFQALGLRSLLMSSLQLEGFRHATIQGEEYCAVIIKQRTQYLALLVSYGEGISEAFIQWAQNLQPGELRTNPHFRSA